MFLIEGGRLGFYQWDLDQRLIVNHDNVVEVHFSLPSSDSALVCVVYEDGGERYADIPNILLQQAGTLNVYGFCGECVRVAASYRVQARAKPDDYVYTETEVKRYEDLAARIQALEQGAITQETDPTVPAWAKKQSKPTYTPEEVGALPADTKIPAPYVLPVATADTLGGAKVGSGLQMNGEALEVVPEGELELIEIFTVSNESGNKTETRTQDGNGQAYAFDTFVADIKMVIGDSIPTFVNIGTNSIMYESVAAMFFGSEFTANTTFYTRVVQCKVAGMWRNFYYNLAPSSAFYMNPVESGYSGAAFKSDAVNKISITMGGAVPEITVTVQGVRHRD